MKKLH